MVCLPGRQRVPGSHPGVVRVDIFTNSVSEVYVKELEVSSKTDLIGMALIFN